MKYCTHCGAALLTRGGRPAAQLYDEELHKKSNILKLRDCSSCGAAAADKYVECDGALILVDLVLLNPQAYRHVLLNGTYGRLILKMCLLSVICDGYITWWSEAATESGQRGGEFFEQEFQFYVACSKVALGLAAFVATALLASSSSCKQASTCLIGLLMAYSARFCNLIAFLWATPSQGSGGGNGGSGLMWSFVYLLFYFATVRVLQISIKRGLVTSAAVSAVCHAAFLFVTNLEWLMQPATCA